MTTEMTESRRLATLAALEAVPATDHASAESAVQELIGSHPRDRGPMLDDPAIVAEVRGVFRRVGATDTEAAAVAAALRWRRADPTSKPEWYGTFDYPVREGGSQSIRDWAAFADVHDSETGRHCVSVSLCNDQLSPESADALALVLVAAAATARALESGR